MHTKRHSDLMFRADLQGLRAVAVTAVLLAHFEIQGFSGGFIGVDLFFVLSGFLITGLLYKEYEANAKLNILRFYGRRFKRLLPAMLLMIVATLAAAFVLLPTIQAKTQAGSAPFASIWLSNFYFNFSSLDYFNELGAKDLFLHTWSLGVEEQFYVVWPLLILLIIRAQKSRYLRNFGLVPTMLASFSCLLALSFALNLYWTANLPLAAFYQMPSRAWQFALGALIYLAIKHIASREKPLLNGVNSSLALYLGLAAITMSVYSYHERMPYPGWAAVMPSLGAGLIILAGTQLTKKKNPLTWPLLVYIGDRSYSIYLWHWPVLLLFEAVEGPLSNASSITAIALVLLLSEVSYRFVERPFWKGSLSNFEPKRLLQVGLLAMLVSLFVSYHSSRQPVEQPLSDTSKMIQEWHNDAPMIYDMPCDAWFHHDKVQPCVIKADSSTEAENTVVLLGDSIGVQWFTLVAKTFVSQNWRLVVLTKSSCPIVDETYFYERIKRDYEVCDRWREKVLNQLPKWQPEVVIVGSASSYDFTDQEWVSGSLRVWEKIKSSGARVIVIPGTPTIGFDAPTCVGRQIENGKSETRQTCGSDQSDDPAFHVASLLEGAASGVSEVKVLNLNALVCPSRYCHAMNEEGVMVYRDSRHLSDSFVSLLVPEIGPTLINSM